MYKQTPSCLHFRCDKGAFFVMTRIQRLEKSILLGLCAALLAGFCAENVQHTLAEQLTRLQIIAHSDTPEDQALKLQVRDTVAAMAENLTAECRDAQTAQRILTASLAQIEDAARLTVYQNSRVTPVKAMLAPVYYPTRDYGSFRLPAGEYMALRVVLGEGKGQNWWCVAYPALCSAAAKTELEEKGRSAGMEEWTLRLITDDGTAISLRFWLVDAVGRFCRLLQDFR